MAIEEKSELDKQLVLRARNIFLEPSIYYHTKQDFDISSSMDVLDRLLPHPILPELPGMHLNSNPPAIPQLPRNIPVAGGRLPPRRNIGGLFAGAVRYAVDQLEAGFKEGGTIYKT